MLPEGSREWYTAVAKALMQKDMRQYDNLVDMQNIIYNFSRDYDLEYIANRQFAIKLSTYAHKIAKLIWEKTGDERYSKVYWDLLLFEARNYQIDSGLLYLEKNRKQKEKFYEPRRAVFMKHGIIQGFQDLIDDKLDLMTVSLPPGTGKSTIEVFFLSLVGGWFPNNFNLSSAHSSILIRSLYDGVAEIIDDPVEYTWHEIFPKVKEQGRNAKETTINMQRPGRFKTWTFRSIDGSLTGATRCDKYLTADDLVSGIEEALNKNRLTTLWSKVVNDLRSRMLDGCKEVYFATRWSTDDPIGRIINLEHGNPRVCIISVPALDENGESNFEYDVNGFSKEYFENKRRYMDEISFNCLYMQMPVDREGLLFPPDSLRRFFLSEDQVPDNYPIPLIFPTREPDAIWAVCDTKDKGKDFESMPIAYQYGMDFFIPDVVFDDNTDYEILDKKTADALINHNPHMVRFESNNAGSRVAYNIEALIKGKTRVDEIEKKFTTANKETKIIVNSAWIKKHCVFLDPSLYSPNSDYGKFMGNVCSYSTKTKPDHDDGADSLAMLAEYVNSVLEFGDGTATVGGADERPF